MRTNRSFRIQLLMAFFLCSFLFMAGCGGDNTTNTTQMGGAIQGKELVLTTTVRIFISECSKASRIHIDFI